MEDINREIFELGRQIGREELLKTLEDKEDEIRYIRTSNWEEHANIITKQRDIWRDRAKQLWDLLKGIENLPFNYPYNEAKTIAQKRNEVYTPGLNWIKGMVKGETREEHWNLHRKIEQLGRQLQGATEDRNRWMDNADKLWELLGEVEDVSGELSQAGKIARKRHGVYSSETNPKPITDFEHSLYKANKKIELLEKRLQEANERRDTQLDNTRQRKEWKNRSEVLWGLLEEIENLPVNYPYCPSDEARRIAKTRHDICTIYKKRDKP